MKKYLKTFPDKCIACRVCETTCSQLYFKKEDAELSCIRISETAECKEINVCNQCQVCVAVCPTLALKVNPQGVVMIDKSLCIGCYMCVAACPTKSMHRHVEGLYPFKCVACGVCAKNCPTEAIKIVNE
ncbi:MAG: 4Fe-4S binding protein [Candidatus Cloacimonetes bacterium]|nr:4Fe-4S binding protein [Candidatus Cloacimonadota bacterium]